MNAMTLLLLKASLLLLAAFLARHLLRSASATRRHGVWSAVFVALLALPLLAWMLPPVSVTLPSWAAAPESEAEYIGAVPGVAAPVGERFSEARTTAATPLAPITPLHWELPRPSLRTLAIAIWAVGASVALFALIVSFARVRRLAQSGRVLDDADWRAARARVVARLGYGHDVRLIACPGIRTPMAGGLVRPTVFVPDEAWSWDAQRREIVLAHEIAHLASRDPLRNLVTRIACTVYWFHPLVWLAVRDALADCEQACDETVLSLGVRPSAYAGLLLDFAAGPVLDPRVAVPMVRRDRLEQRLNSILENTPRPRSSRPAILPAVAFLGLALSVAAVHPVRQSFVPRVMEFGDMHDPVAVPPAPAIPAAPAVSAIASAPEAPAAPAAPPAETFVFQERESSCWTSRRDSRPFNGSMSMSGSTIHQQIGHRGGDNVIQTSFGDLRVCMITDGFDGEDDDRPSRWIGRSDRVILETSRANDVRVMDVRGNLTTYTVNGQSRPVDAAAREWRDRLLAVLDDTWDISQLRGRVSTMRGEISTIHGERSTLEGEISTLRGHVSTLRGEISTLRGQHSTMLGEISTIRGHESTLRGQISSERGAISSLEGSSWDRDRADVAARISRHRDNIRRIEDEIARFDVDERVREVQRRIDDFDVERRVAEVERRLQGFDVESKVAAVRRQIDRLDVAERVDGIEGEIRSLDANRNVRGMEARRDQSLARLRTLLGR